MKITTYTFKFCLPIFAKLGKISRTGPNGAGDFLKTGSDRIFLSAFCPKLWKIPIPFELMLYSISYPFPLVTKLSLLVTLKLDSSLT